MLLNEITTSDDRKIQKINKVLKETYGFTLVSEIKTGTLNTLYTKISDDLYDLKLDLSTVKDSAYMQKVLVLEGLKILIAKNNRRLEEQAVLAGKGGRAFTRILGELTKFVEKVCNMGDDYEEAIKDAMKHYRSSIYRFSDDLVEYELRKATESDCTDTMLGEVYEASEYPECADCKGTGLNKAGDGDCKTCSSVTEEVSCCDKCDCDPCECDKVNEAGLLRRAGSNRTLRKYVPKLGKREAGERSKDEFFTGEIFRDAEAGAGEDGPILSPSMQRHKDRSYSAARRYNKIKRGRAPFKEMGEAEEITEGSLDLKPQERWWENDPNDLMSYLYWKKDQIPPSGRAFEVQWKKVVAQLSAKNPPPEDWVNPIADSGSSERECPQCKGRKAYPSNDEPCSRCNATGRVTEDGIEEGGDRHAEHDWVRTMKKDAGIDAGPGYADDSTGGLSLLDPEETQQDDADDYFSYRSKQKRTEMKEGYVKELRKLLEAETDQAESLIAAKSFSQELQDMVEKLGRLVNENLPAVSEQMRDAYGSDVATGFEDLVSGTLNSVMDSLRQSKQEIDNSVSTIADGGAPAAGSDMENYSDEQLGGEFDDAELELDGDVELDLGDEELGDEFGGDDAMAGLEDEPLGRAKKEALLVIGKKLVETKAKLARIKARK